MHCDNRRNTLTRKELYDIIWKEPVVKLAKDFGISDVGLAKVCRRHDIPLPPRGYWAKLQHGRCVPPQPVLSNKRPLDEEISISGHQGEKLNTKSKLSDIVESPPSLEVPESLIDPDPLIEKTAKILRSARRGDGLIQPRKKSYILDLSVSYACLERALCIFDTLIKALKQLDLPVTISKEPRITFTEIEGERLEFQLKEELDNIPHILTKAELRQKEQGYWYGIPKYDAVPSDRLTLSITNLDARGLQRNWSDGKHQRLENRLESFLLGLFQASTAIKIERAEQERREREWEAERKRQEEAKRWRLLEEKRVEKFQNKVSDWRFAQDYWAFIEQVETLASKSYTEIPKEIQDWVEWAKQKVEYLDPLFHELPTLLTMDKFLEEKPYLKYRE